MQPISTDVATVTFLDSSDVPCGKNNEEMPSSTSGPKPNNAPDAVRPVLL